MTINNNNEAVCSGGVYIGGNFTVTFEGNSIATVNKNEAERGESIYINSSNIMFKSNSSVIIKSNQAVGGAICLHNNSNVIHKENSLITINNNQANFGGAIYIDEISRAKFKGNSTATIDDNQARIDGGALHVSNYNLSDVSFEERLKVSFNSNKTSQYGGARCFWS